jgi:ABC-2 type transport system permease protein
MYSFTSPEDACAMTKKYHPLRELLLSRMREFIREPEAIFWVYGFPLLLALGLGIAFRNQPADKVFVDVQQGPAAAAMAQNLHQSPDMVVAICAPEDCRNRLRLGKSSLVVIPGDPATFMFDPTRSESVLARQRVNDVLQRAAGRRDAFGTREEHLTQPGARYIDFLIPGLLGMNLMGSGLWGVGYVIVDMRVRKLLKRLIATPMKRETFLWSMISARLLFVIPELVIVLSAGVLVFGMLIRGTIFAILVLCLAGAIAFSGLGLLVASRAQRLETVSGLMNLVMLPMWLFSGIFFSSERFPAILQPFVRALPLTQLNNALRAVILEGAPLASQAWSIAILALWGGVCFLLASAGSAGTDAPSFPETNFGCTWWAVMIEKVAWQGIARHAGRQSLYRGRRAGKSGTADPQGGGTP